MERKDFTLGFVEKHRAQYWDNVNAGIARAALQFGVATKITAPEDENVDDQLRLIEELVDGGIDGLGVVGTQPAAMVPIIDELVESGLPVVTFDLDVPGSKRQLYVGLPDYEELGRRAGDEMVRRLEPGQRVLVLPGSGLGQGAVSKVKGFVDTVSESGLEVSVTELDHSDHARSYELAAEGLAGGEFHGAFGPYAFHPGVLARAIADVSPRRRPIVIGFDMAPATIEAIKSGAVAGSIWIREYYFGLHACTAMALMVRFGVPETLELLQQQGSPAGRDGRLLLEPELYTRTNIDAYLDWYSETVEGAKSNH